MKLDVGCGRFKRDETYIGVDPFMGGDVTAPMWALPFGDSEADEIFTSHAMEHITKHDVPKTLLEFKRVIKPGRLIIIEVPDLVWCCQQWLSMQSNDWYMDILFGMQNWPGEEHRTGYTPGLMASYMLHAGLTLISFTTVESHGQPTLRFEATK